MIGYESTGGFEATAPDHRYCFTSYFDHWFKPPVRRPPDGVGADTDTQQVGEHRSVTGHQDVPGA